MKIMSLDMETTDLPTAPHSNLRKLDQGDLNEWTRQIERWPHVIQWSYIVWDTNTQQSKIRNWYMTLRPGVQISHGSSRVTAIYSRRPSKTKTHRSPLSQKKKHATQRIYLSDIQTVPMCSVLSTFMKDFDAVDKVVGHNVGFDKRMILAELWRCYQNTSDWFHRVAQSPKFVCTMKQTTELCRLFLKSNPKAFKKPKLTEAYQHLFGPLPKAPHHNALVDAAMTLRIYMQVAHGQDILNSNSNTAIKKLLVV